MNFATFEYALFLWCAYVVYWTLRNERRLRHAFVLVASYWFYAQADWRFLALLFTSTVVDYTAGLRMAAARGPRAARTRRRWMGASLAANLGLLGFFKYFDFFVESFERLFASFGWAVDPWYLSADRGGPLDYVVPVGISFYTFQTLSYSIDVYRGRMRPCRSFLDFAMYVSFFPQLVAGPIVRARDFLPQLRERVEPDAGRLGRGLFLILRGTAKKLLLADVLGAHLVDVVYRDAGSMSGVGAWGLVLTNFAYGFQLYCDFSGYSDIAIGSARLLGIELKKNFDAPFQSRNLEEFWGRWHISLSTWIRDYVYVGLGGSQGGTARTCRNLLIAMAAVGIWHGAAWTFLLWGVVQGVALILRGVFRRLIPGGSLPDTPAMAVLGAALTFTWMTMSMVLFRAPDMATFGAACGELGVWNAPLPQLSWHVWAAFLAAAVTHFLPRRWSDALERGFARTPAVLQGVVIAALVLVFFVLSPPGLTPFIYFQF